MRISTHGGIGQSSDRFSNLAVSDSQIDEPSVFVNRFFNFAVNTRKIYLSAIGNW